VCKDRTDVRIRLPDRLLMARIMRIQRFGHNRISLFGGGKDLSETEWKSVFRQLVAAGFLNVDIGGKGGFKLNSSCRPVLKGEQRFQLRKDPVPLKSKAKSAIGKTGRSPKRRKAGDLRAFAGRALERLLLCAWQSPKNKGSRPTSYFMTRH